MLMSPQIASHISNRVREGRTLFGVPRGTAHRQVLRLQQARRQQGDDRVEGEDSRRRARYRLRYFLLLMEKYV